MNMKSQNRTVNEATKLQSNAAKSYPSCEDPMDFSPDDCCADCLRSYGDGSIQAEIECECEQLMHDKEFAGRHHDECPKADHIKTIDRTPHCEPGQHFWLNAGEECSICHRVIKRDGNSREIVEPESDKS